MSNLEEDLVMRRDEAILAEQKEKIEEMKRERQERNQVRAAILTIEERLGELDTSQNQRVEQSERRLEEIMRNIQGRLEPLEETDRLDRMEKRLEEIVAKLERNKADNLQKGMKELKAANLNLLERMTRLEDRITGGNKTILIMGGERGRVSLDEMVILDRKTSTWKKLNLKLPCENSDGGSALLNGEIYIFGGDGLEEKLYKLDSKQMKWIKLAEMNEEREGTSSLVFQGYIWVFGGWEEHGEGLNTVEKYCPERNKWIEMPGMSQKRSWAAAVVCNEKIFVAGGENNEILLRSVECFDPTSEVWTPMVDLPGGRDKHSMISDGSSLFVMGGRDGNAFLKTVWRICPSEENAIWEELQPMNEERGYFTTNSLCCTTLDYKKEIYAIGGWNGKKSLDSVEIFDGERWREGPKLPNGCDSMSSVVIPPSLAETLIQYRK